MADVVNFVSSLHERSLEYSTINSYRSGLSAFHPEIGGTKVGQQSLVVKLLKGNFNDRPPKPRYTETWDVKLVLELLITLGDNDMMDICKLSHKTAMLMAITSAARGSKLRMIDPTCMSDNDDSVEFHIRGLTKGKRQSKPMFSLSFYKFVENARLDVVDAIHVYLKRT